MNPSLRIVAIGLAAIVGAGVARAADDAVQTVKAGSMTFKVPASWKSERPSNQMRLAQVKVEAAAGDDEPAEMAISQAGGGVAGNIKRWEGQFQDGEKAAAKAKVQEMKGTNVEVTRVEIAGRYVAAMMPGQPGKNDKPNYRLLGAIVKTPDGEYFFKMVGPDKTVLAASKGFDAMIESMTLGK